MVTYEELHGQLIRTFRKQCEMWVINGGHLPFPEMATAAIATIREVLSEPDEFMIDEMCDAMFGAHYGEDAKRIMFIKAFYERLAAASHAAMLEASPLVEEKQTNVDSGGNSP